MSRRGQQNQRTFSPEEIWTSAQAPELRWGDVPGGDSLLGQLMIHPEDAHLRELFEITLRQQQANAMLAADPYWGNYPPVGSLPALTAGRVPVAALPLGGVLSVPVSDVTKNVLVVGPTGGGKTTWLRLMIAALLARQAAENEMATIVAFDRKGDLTDCETLSQAGLPLVEFDWSELKIAMLQPVPGMALGAFVNVLVQLLGSHLSLIASRRLMLETLHLLYRRQRPAGLWPTLSEWVELIERIHANSVSRLGQYREAVLYALKGILNELGDVVNYAASDFLERVFASHGCFVVRAAGLSPDAASLLAGLFINWVYEYRGLTAGHADGRESVARPIVFVLDDALPLVRGSAAGESEGGINPLSTWAFMSRARNIGFVIAAQNFSLISPALRNNSDTLLCFGSYGRDAEELGRHLSLSREQRELLPVIRPGEVIAIARSTWPLAVYGRVPEVG